MKALPGRNEEVVEQNQARGKERRCCVGATRFEEKPRGAEVEKEARGKVSARKGKR